MRSLFRDPQFLAYFAGRLGVVSAYMVESVAISWQIWLLRHAPMDLGIVGLLLFLPMLLMALPSGVLADRFDRRLVSSLGCAAEMAGLLVFVGLSHARVHSIGAYFGAVLFIGFVHAAGAAAERSLLTNVVSAQQYIRAAALSSSAMQLMSVAGPAIAGVLIAVSLPFAFSVSAALYLAGAVAFALLRSQRIGHEEVPTLRSAFEGVRYIWHHKIVLGAISMDLFAVLFGGAVALLPVYATQILHVGPTGFGFLRAAQGLGAAAVALWIARHPVRRRGGPTLLWCVAMFGVFTVVFGLSRNFWLSFLALALTGGFDMVSMVIRNVLVQLGTPNDMRGRVSSVENVFISASNQLGAFESGALAAWLGAEASVVVGGVGTLIVVLLTAWWSPELRTFDKL